MFCKQHWSCRQNPSVFWRTRYLSLSGVRAFACCKVRAEVLMIRTSRVHWLHECWNYFDAWASSHISGLLPPQSMLAPLAPRRIFIRTELCSDS